MVESLELRWWLCRRGHTEDTQIAPTVSHLSTTELRTRTQLTQDPAYTEGPFLFQNSLPLILRALIELLEFCFAT